MAKFFIDRPIFAWVISILIMLAGGLAIFVLPVEQYPKIAPPEIGIRATYPGASAKTLEDTVTQVIEQQMNGLDGLRFMTSESNSSGSVSMTLTFEQGTDPDIAQVQVQNKLSAAMTLLPEEVQRQGIRVYKSTRDFLQIFSFVSEDGSMNREDIADYVASNILDAVARVPGVGETQLFGSAYAMRIWLNPDKLVAYKLTPSDIAAVVRAQNAQTSAGQLGGLPSVEGQALNATITAQSRLTTVEEFENILVRVNGDGSQIRLKDVARIELNGQDFSTDSYVNGKPAASLAVKLAAGANALATAEAVQKKLDELSQFFPHGLTYQVTMDTTPLVRLSIESVVHTLFEAIVLVFLVMFLFLQNFRATLVPTIAAPVVLLGAFGAMKAFGFSINTLTMFGLVLAIGLLVDDAIVVVENVERVMEEEGLPPREATKKSMGQITSALFGVTSVLSAVFVPMAFFGGSTGVIYRQFSLTIVSSMVLSLLVAMTLTPALCATLLKPSRHHGAERKGFFGWFNRTYARANELYDRVVAKILVRRGRSMLVYVAIVAIMGVMLVRLPTAFLPDEDQGRLIAMVTLPPGATLQQTNDVLKRMSDQLLETEKETVDTVMTITGFNFGGQGQNNGMAFINLRDWSQRKEVEKKAHAVAGRANVVFRTVKEAMVYVVAPPAIPGLGTSSGFDVQLQDRGGHGHDALMAARNQLLAAAAQHPALARVRPGGQEDTPQYKIEIDEERAAALGLNMADVNATLSSAWGGTYINDFVDRGRVKKVYMQADAPYRMNPEDLKRWYVRNNEGKMVPFDAFATGRWVYGSPRLERFNGLPSVNIQGEAAPGYSSGEAMAAIEEIARSLPAGFGLEWSGISYEERLSGSQAPALYAVSLLVIFLCLAALYESWSIPFSVMLVVPLGVIGALAAAYAFGLSNDVYFQVGLLTTIGLSAKNAILIVEFAKELHEQGMGLFHAALQAARMRLRPILMTSLAFILGVVPLATANGAGSGGQNAIGIGVIGGMLSGTFLAVLFVPVFFKIIVGSFGKKKAEAPAAPAPALEGGAHG